MLIAQSPVRTIMKTMATMDSVERRAEDSLIAVGVDSVCPQLGQIVELSSSCTPHIVQKRMFITPLMNISVKFVYNII